MLPKIDTWGPNPEPEFTRLPGTWLLKQYFNQILSNRRHTEAWKPVSLLEFESTAFLGRNPCNSSSVPKSWEKQKDLKLLNALYTEPLPQQQAKTVTILNLRRNLLYKLLLSHCGLILPLLEWERPSSPEAETAEVWSFWTSPLFWSHWSPLPGRHTGTSFQFNAERQGRGGMGF